MGAPPPEAAAKALLESCIHTHQWPRHLLNSLVDEATHADPDRAQRASDALFGILVEGLADRFDPDCCEVYASLFPGVIARVLPGHDARLLTDRYRRIRRPRRCSLRAAGAARVFVLSRVTLGADVAVTSTILDGLKLRFPQAQLELVGSRKSWGLFAADPRIGLAELFYPRRAPLRARLEAGIVLHDMLNQPGAIVVDPDSRLTQLGLLPVCPDENYFFFESRSFGGCGRESMSELAARWMQETFEVPNTRPWIAPVAASTPHRDPIAVSLGTGGNPNKRIPDPFEADLLRQLVNSGAHVIVDCGAGGEERDRVHRAVARSGARPRDIELFEGSFAAFASIIARSALYVGYDSSGQHVAAACGVPLIAVFAGFVSERMLDRWRPTGPGFIHVIPVRNADPASVMLSVQEALAARLAVSVAEPAL